MINKQNFKRLKFFLRHDKKELLEKKTFKIRFNHSDIFNFCFRNRKKNNNKLE